MTNPTSLRRVAITLYVLSVLLLVSPLFELFIGVWPPRIGDTQWRFAFLGLTASSSLTPLVAMVFLFIAATVLEHRWVLTTIGIVAAVMGALMLVGAGAFALDMAQLRHQVRAEQRTNYDLASLKALLNFLLAAAVLATIAVGALKKDRTKVRTETPQLIASLR